MANFEFVRRPDVLTGGFGNLPMARVQASIEMIRSASGITATLAEKDFYLPQFLPVADQLRLPAATE